MTTESRSLLLVEDDEAFAERLTRALRSRGFDVRRAATCESALAAAEEDSPELALVDLRLPDGHGLDVVRRLREIDDTTCIIVLTGYGAIATAVESLKLGASDYLTKPVDADQVMAAFEKAESGQSVGGGGDPSTGPGPPRPRSRGDFTVPSLARVEWEHIQRVITECGGNISQAARVLGLHRRSLQRKLSKYPVHR
jgi:two-component system response regulator RegA